MKKRKIFMILVLSLCFSSIIIKIGILNNNKTRNIEVVRAEAKTDSFDSLEDLENEAPIIIKGIKIDEVGTEITESSIEDGVVVGGCTRCRELY